MTIELGVGVGLLCTLIGAAVGIAGYKRAVKSEAVAAGKTEGMILTELGYVRAGIDDIKLQQRRQDENHVGLVARMVAVEASSKQAHHRIDRIDYMLQMKKGGG